jgi:L-histidine N-alpha-methyltransferase
MIAIEVHLDADTAATMARDVRTGLSADPKELAPKYFYDERGSQLFERITELPEYYPTRAERSILAERAAEIIAAAGAELDQGPARPRRPATCSARCATPTA